LSLTKTEYFDEVFTLNEEQGCDFYSSVEIEVVMLKTVAEVDYDDLLEEGGTRRRRVLQDETKIEALQPKTMCIGSIDLCGDDAIDIDDLD